MHPSNVCDPITVTESGILTLLSEVQPRKALSLIFVTDSGIIVDPQPVIRVFVLVSIKALQPSRESYTGLPSATTILSIEVHPSNACDPITVTKSGILTLLSEVQPRKALSLIFVTDSGIIVDPQPVIRVFVLVSIKALQPSRESYTGLPSATTILSSEVQPRKAPHPISVTDLGITTLSSEVQPLKAPHPISVTDLGITTFSSEVQPSNARISITVTESEIITFSSEVQPSNARALITVTESGMITLLRELRFAKARSSITLVPLGMMPTPSFVLNFAIIIIIFFDS